MSQNEVVINVSEGEASENDEGPSNPKKIRRYFTITKKLEVVDFAKKNSVNAASRNFNVDRKCVKEWMEQEKQLRYVKTWYIINLMMSCLNGFMLDGMKNNEFLDVQSKFRHKND